jgi:hypothetical protein
VTSPTLHAYLRRRQSPNFIYCALLCLMQSRLERDRLSG